MTHAEINRKNRNGERNWSSYAKAGFDWNVAEEIGSLIKMCVVG
jgi:hypothetical protein